MLTYYCSSCRLSLNCMIVAVFTTSCELLTPVHVLEIFRFVNLDIKLLSSFAAVDRCHLYVLTVSINNDLKSINRFIGNKKNWVKYRSL